MIECEGSQCLNCRPICDTTFFIQINLGKYSQGNVCITLAYSASTTLVLRFELGEGNAFIFDPATIYVHALLRLVLRVRPGYLPDTGFKSTDVT